MSLYTYRCQLVRVIDGDTVEVTIDLGFHLSLQRPVRLKGINAPETKGESKAAGEKAAAHLFALLVNRPGLTIQTFLDKEDKYGRVLGVFFDGDKNINAQMVMDGYAVPYMV